MSFHPPRAHSCRISDEWTYRGMRTLIIENELLRVTVLLDRGSDIVEFRYKPRDLDFLHFGPHGLRDPARETPSAYTNSPYLDVFNGGWNEILPNGGPPVLYQGARLGQHGEISLLPGAVRSWQTGRSGWRPGSGCARCARPFSCRRRWRWRAARPLSSSRNVLSTRAAKRCT